MTSTALLKCPRCLCLSRLASNSSVSAFGHLVPEGSGPKVSFNKRTFSITKPLEKTRKRNAFPLPKMFTAADLPERGGDTYVVERLWRLPPGPDGGRPEPEQMNELYKILDVKEVITYPRDMDCLLTDFVDGLGIRGDLVRVKRDVFHSSLYPEGLAVYASPENIAEFEEEKKALGIDGNEIRLGVTARMTLKELNNMKLDVYLRGAGGWSLNERHVQVAFRLMGIELDKDCIQLPEEPVTEFGETEVTVMVNNIESIKVKANILPIEEKFVKKIK